MGEKSREIERKETGAGVDLNERRKSEDKERDRQIKRQRERERRKRDVKNTENRREQVPLASRDL